MHICCALLVALACVVRLVHLDADPVFPTWVGYIVDEGRWNESARNLALFGHADAFADRLHLMISPVYQMLGYLAFKWQGINLVSARASSALAGCAIVIATALLLRRHVSAFALALGIIVLGFETNMLAESRMALPEIPAAFATLASAMILLVGRQTRKNAALAGVVLSIALGLKGTVALVAPALVVIALLPNEQLSLRRRLVRALIFTAVPLALVLAGLIVGVTLQLLALEGLRHIGSRLLSFVSASPPNLVVWAFFESQGHAVRNILLLGAWSCSWIWFHRAPGPQSMAVRVYLASAVWAGWATLVWALNAYSPGRYVVHLVVPATVHLMAGLTLADGKTLTRIEDRFIHGVGAPAQLLWSIWLVLPAAVVVASLVVGTSALLGLEVTRVADRAALVAASALALALLLRSVRARKPVIATLLLGPVLAVLLWRLGWELRWFRGFWDLQSAQATLLWMAACVVAVACVLASTLLATMRPHILALQIGVLALVATPMIVQAMGPIWAPTFTLRDASRDIGRLLPPSTAGRVSTHSASSLFLENRVDYRELSRAGDAQDWLVVFELNQSVRRLLRSDSLRNFERIKSYPITVDPRYEYDPDLHGLPRVTLLHRRQSQPASGPGTVLP